MGSEVIVGDLAQAVGSPLLAGFAGTASWLALGMALGALLRHLLARPGPSSAPAPATGRPEPAQSAAEALLAPLLESPDTLIWHADAALKLQWASPQTQHLLGVGARSFVGVPLTSTLTERSGRALLTELETLSARHEGIRNLLLSRPTAAGATEWFLCTVHPQPDPEGGIEGWWGVERAVTALVDPARADLILDEGPLAAGTIETLLEHARRAGETARLSLDHLQPHLVGAHAMLERAERCAGHLGAFEADLEALARAEEAAPIADGDHLPPPGTAAPAPETALICEDDAGELAVAARTLRGAGFEAIEALSASTALRALRAHGPRVTLFVVGGDGAVLPELERVAREVGAQPRWLLLIPPDAPAPLEREGRVAALRRPFTAGQLEERVESLLSGATARPLR